MIKYWKCRFPGCHDRATVSEFCTRHYNRRFYREQKDSAPNETGTPCPICGERIINLSGHMTFHHGISPSKYYEEHGICCAFPYCDKPIKCRGVCNTHYSWLKRHGLNVFYHR